MEDIIPILGYETVFKDIAINFPAQHQDTEPSMEYLMDPRLIFDDINYIGTCKFER